MNFRLSPIALVAVLAGCAAGTPRAPDVPTIDTHVDIPLDYMRVPRYDVGTDTALRVDLGKMERGGLDAAFFVIYVGQGPLTADGYATAVAEAARKYDAIDAMLRRYPDRIRAARSPAELLANHAAGVLSAAIGIENGYSLGHDLARLDAAFARGARYIGLTHVGNNDLCTSSMPDRERGEADPPVDGLTDFGRAVVDRANRLGMMVDVSHASDACVRDVLALSRAPIIASHSSARALADHPRNLPDDLLRAIAAHGGVIQAVAYREFVKVDPARKQAEAELEAAVAREAGATEFDGERHESLPSYVAGLRRIQAQHPLATLDEYVAHVAHIARVAGIDHVGIASDFDGGGYVDGWMDASQTGNLIAALRRHGFSAGAIAKIRGGNLLRVWSDAEAVARSLSEEAR